MRTQKQREASRANGRRSHGPVTPEGKQRSSQNAVRHGLLAQTVVMQHESLENFQIYLDQDIARFHPADDVEMNVIEEMVAAAWRLRRTWGLQNHMLDREVETHTGELAIDAMAAAFTKLAGEPGLALLQRYETRLHLTYHRCINTLLRLQKSRTDISPVQSAETEPAQPNEGVRPGVSATPENESGAAPEAAVRNEPEKLLKTQDGPVAAAMPQSPSPCPHLHPGPQIPNTSKLPETGHKPDTGNCTL